MKKLLALTLAAVFIASVLTACGEPKNAAIGANIRVTSSDGEDAAAWLTARLGDALTDRVVLGTAADGYGIDVSTLEADGYFIRSFGREDVLFAKTADGLDRAVRKYAKCVESGAAVADVTYHEGYRVKSVKLAGRDISEYTIYIEDETYLRSAAKDLASLLGQACGVSPAIEKTAPAAPFIEIKYVHDEALGNVGHRWNVTEDGVVLECSDKYPSQSAALAVRRFLVKYLDWAGLIFGFADLAAADEVSIPVGASLEESVAFEYASPCSSQHVLYEKLPNQMRGYGVSKLSCHGMQGNRFAGDLSLSPDRNWAWDQPCWLDEEFYEAAREDIVAFIEARGGAAAVESGALQFVDVAHGDNSNWCRCKECQKLYIAEGGTHAAEVLTWVNRLSDDLNETYPGLYYGVFAYEMTKKPPKTVRPNGHVYITFCYDRSCSAHPLDGSRCTTMDQWGKDHDNPNLSAWLETWLSFTKNVYVWYYGLHNDLSTMSFIHTVRDDLRYMRDVGVKGIYWESHEAGFSTNWVAYCLQAELLWNVDMSDAEYDALYDRYLRAFYGDAANTVKEYLAVLSSVEEHGQCVACWAGLISDGWKYTNVNDDLYAERFDLLYSLIELAVTEADTFAEARRLEMVACNCAYVGCLASYPKAQAAGDEARMAELCERYAKIDERLTKYGMDMTNGDTLTTLWPQSYPRTLPEVFSK